MLRRIFRQPVTYLVGALLAFVLWGHLRIPSGPSTFALRLDRLEFIGTHPATAAALGLLVLGWGYSLCIKQLRRTVGGTSAALAILAVGTVSLFGWRLKVDQLHEQIGRSERQASVAQNNLAAIDATRQELNRLLDQHRQRSPEFGIVELAADWAIDIRKSYPEIPSLIDLLRVRVDAFVSELGSKDMGKTDSLRLRLAEATILNVDRRYQKTVGHITEADIDDASSPAPQEYIVGANQVRGDGYYGLQNWAEAIAHYERILEINEFSWSTRIDLANCLYNSDRHTEAISHYDILVNHRTRQVNVEDKQELAESLAAILSRRANALLGIPGRLNDAVADYDEAITLYGRLYERSDRRELAGALISALNNRGFALAGRLQFERAVRDYDRAIGIRTKLVEHELANQVDNNRAGTLNNRGVALAGLGKLTDAIDDYNEAIEIRAYLVEKEGLTVLANSLASALNNRGLAQAGLRKFDRAIKSYDQAARIRTKLIDDEGKTEFGESLAGTLTDRGLTYVGIALQTNRPNNRNQNLQKAIKNYNKSIWYLERIHKNSDNPYVADEMARTINHRCLAYSYAGRHDHSIRGYDRSIDIYRDLLEKDPESPFASGLARTLSYRGLAYADQGRATDAIVDYELAIEKYSRLLEKETRLALNRELANTLNNLGNALVALRKFDSAIPIFNRAADIYSDLHQKGFAVQNDLARSINNRGNTYLNLGKLDRVLDDYDQAIEIRTKLVEKQKKINFADDLAGSLMDRGFHNYVQGRKTLAFADLEKAKKVARQRQMKDRIGKTLADLREEGNKPLFTQITTVVVTEITPDIPGMQLPSIGEMELMLADASKRFMPPMQQQASPAQAFDRIVRQNRRAIDELNSVSQPIRLRTEVAPPTMEDIMKRRKK